MALTRIHYTEANILEMAGAASTAERGRAILWAFASMLTGLVIGTPGRTGAIPVGARWTGEGASDSVTAGLDGDMRGLTGATYTAGKWVGNTGVNAHSWALLSKTIAGVKWWLLIECRAVALNTADLTIYKGGTATGGTINAAPTFTSVGASHLGELLHDQYVASNGEWLHMSMDANGHFWFLLKRAGVLLGSIAGGVIGFWDVLDAHASDDNAWMFLANLGGSVAKFELTDSATYQTGSSVKGCNKGGTVQVSQQISILGGSNGPLNDLAAGMDTIRGNNPAHEAYVFVKTVGSYGYRGKIPDVLIGAKIGDGYKFPPAPADHEQVLVGGWYLPLMIVPTTG